MAARHGQKIKLLYILDILREQTDEEHPLSAGEICEKLASLGVTAERKAIYDDIECLNNYGYDIINTRTPKNGYFLASRQFEEPEIYLLADAVRTAKFISVKKTVELTKKLDKMLSYYRRNDREKGIYINSSGKTKNEAIFYNIDAISSAIKNGHKVKLKYGVRTLAENREILVNYKERVISPYAMTWQDDHYYLIGNYEKYENPIHLRIDRMHNVIELNEPVRPMNEIFHNDGIFNVADYTSKLFNMHGGDLTEIELCCDRSIIEQVADRFGEGIFIKNLTDTHFSFNTSAALSEPLATWIMNYGEKIEVIKPEKLKDMIKVRAKKILKKYSN